MSVKIDKGQAAGLINMTPMIDVVFQLLLFFLVASRFAEEERSLKLALPKASDTRPLTAATETFTVNVDARGQFVVNRRLVDRAQLETAMRRASQQEPGRLKVAIRADRDTRTQPLVTILELCNKLNVAANIQVEQAAQQP
jgi:biopolymer transport protein ExbD